MTPLWLLKLTSFPTKAECQLADFKWTFKGSAKQQLKEAYTSEDQGNCVLRFELKPDFV